MASFAAPATTSVHVATTTIATSPISAAFKPTTLADLVSNCASTHRHDPTPISATALRLNPNRVSESKRRFLPKATMDTATFVVRGKFVECLICGMPSVGLNVRTHANGREHTRKLQDSDEIPGALTVEQAEALLQVSTSMGRKKRRKAYNLEKKAASAPLF